MALIQKQGKHEVWQHAKEVGMSEDIALIAKYFDIKDVSIIGGGKISFMEDMPRKMKRVPAVPGLSFYREEGKRIQEEMKAKRNAKSSRLKR